MTSRADLPDGERLIQRLDAGFARAAAGVLRPGCRVLCAASGGADSAALAAALARAELRLGLSGLALVHIDHRLRPSSKDDVAVARQLAEGLGLRFHLREVQVGRGEGPEGGARRARYAALAALALELGAEAVAVGHTRTDQAETVLLRLLRGAGPRGLAAMAPSRSLAPGVRLVRPWLDFSRADVRAYAAALALPTFEDPTNADLRFQRNALRALWPQLVRLSPGLERRLATLARICRDDEAALGALAAAALEGLRESGGGLAVATLTDLPPAVARRVLQRHVAARAPMAQPTAEQLERLLVLARRGRPGKAHLAGDLEARIWKGSLRILPRLGEPLEPPPFAYEIGGEGLWPCPLAGLALRVTPWEGPDPEVSAGLALCLARESIRFPLVLRSRRPGDRFHPSGAKGSRKLKAFLIDLGIPRERRGQLALLCSDGAILWVIGHRRGEAARPPAPGASAWLLRGEPLMGT